MYKKDIYLVPEVPVVPVFFKSILNYNTFNNIYKKLFLNFEKSV